MSRQLSLKDLVSPLQSKRMLPSRPREVVDSAVSCERIRKRFLAQLGRRRRRQLQRPQLKMPRLFRRLSLLKRLLQKPPRQLRKHLLQFLAHQREGGDGFIILRNLDIQYVSLIRLM
jgi:hypothetical protein